MRGFRYAALAAFLALAASTAIAQTVEVPRTLSFQGKLTDVSGNAITTAVDVQFTIYDSLTAGNNLWQESHTLTPDGNGLYQVVLGSTIPLGIGFDQAYYLQVSVRASGAGVYEDLAPRYQLTSSAYAMRAARLHHPTVALALYPCDDFSKCWGYTI